MKERALSCDWSKDNAIIFQTDKACTGYVGLRETPSVVLCVVHKILGLRDVAKIVSN